MRLSLIIQIISYLNFYDSDCHKIYSQESSTMPYRQYVELELSSALNEIKQYTDLDEVIM
jgi:hypothetical protein